MFLLACRPNLSVIKHYYKNVQCGILNKQNHYKWNQQCDMLRGV